MDTTSAPRKWFWIAAVAVFAVAIRIAFGILTWEPGWSALTWDDFSRVEIARGWAAEPFVLNGFVWLPLPVWITGSVYALAGQWFASSPMALMAIINTTAIIVAAAISTWTAHRIFKDRVGTLAVFILVLFAPWNYFLSLSGLAEPLYFVAVTVAVAGLVSWVESGRTMSLAFGSVGVAAAAGMRYEGWWLAAAWLLVIIGDTASLMYRRPATRVVKERFGALLISVAPLMVPLAWMGANLAAKGSPVYFAQESARIFDTAYGGFDRVIERVTYYPRALIRSAPLILAFEGLTAYMTRNRRAVVLLVSLFATQFGLFYITSLSSRALGAFPERFLFAFALGLAPLIGGLPAVIRSLVSTRLIRPVGFALIAAVVLVTGLRLQDRPEEWTHAPDLLALNEQIGTVATAGVVSVIAGKEMETDLTPMRVQNGTRIDLDVAGDRPPGLVSDAGVWAERNPGRIANFDLEDAPAIGRFRISGPAADQFELPPCAGCEGWIWIDESGNEHLLQGGPYLGFEFVTDDPTPGESTGVVTSIARMQHPQSGFVDLRWLYGHGFNRYRMKIAATLDGATIFEADIGDPSRWTRVEFEVPAGEGASQLRVEVVAQQGIESGWKWGRASTVLIRELFVETS